MSRLARQPERSSPRHAAARRSVRRLEVLGQGGDRELQLVLSSLTSATTRPSQGWGRW